MSDDNSPVTVFWDWNGTLCDDLSVSLDAVNELLKLKERPPITVEQYYSYVDTPISKFYEHLFDLNEVTMEEISLHYRTYYGSHLPEECLMPGIRTVLEKLRSGRVRQVVLSSAHRDSIEFRARNTGILDFFDDILAADDWYAFSKEERARRYIRERCDDPERIWFIGDAVHDAEVADACGCLERCILVPLGHQSREDLVRTGAIVCDGFDVVPGLIISTCS